MCQRHPSARNIAVCLLVVLLIAQAAPGQAQEGVCDTAPQTRLRIGMWASVTDVVTGTAVGGLRLRAAPRTDSESVEVLPAGTLARVVDGPACNDGFNWWYLSVYATGREGWAAEAFPGSYYLAPANVPADITPSPVGPQPLFPTNTPRAPEGAASPTPPLNPLLATPTPPPAAADSCAPDLPPSYLAVGVEARAADPRRPLRVRADTGVDSVYTDLLYPDTPITIIGGPECVEGQRWWNVSYRNRAGWTVETAGGRYLMINPNQAPPSAIAGTTPPPTPEPTPLGLLPTPRPATPPDVLKRAAYAEDEAGRPTLAVGSDDGVHLYDGNTLAPLGTLSVGPVLDFVTIDHALYAVTWAPEGVRLVAVPGGQTRTTLLNAPYDPLWAAAVPDGQWLILGPSAEGVPASLWDLRTGAVPDDLPYWWQDGGDTVQFAAFTPDGQYVLLDDIFYARSCIALGAGCAFDLIRQDYLPAGPFFDADFSHADMAMFAFAGQPWGWDGNPMGIGFTLQSTLNTPEPRRAAISPDGSDGALAAGAQMEIWNLQAYSAPGVPVLPGPVHSLAFRPDGAQLAAAAGESVTVYDATNGSVIRQVE